MTKYGQLASANGHPPQTERQVLKLIAEYKTNHQIATELFVSPLTVKTHRRNISIKLGLEGKHTLMKFALDHKPSFE